MKTMPRILASAAALAAAFAFAPGVASARKSPLEGQPDVRHKYELRLSRFELSPTFEATVQADYRHTISGGLKAEYHLTDALSIGGLIFFGAGIDTALTEQIEDSLPGDGSVPPGDPTPDKGQFRDHLNDTPLHGGVQATFTPWFGKMNLFGKAYVAFDVYVSGGLGFAQTKLSDSRFDSCERVQDGTDAMGQPLFNDPRNDGACNTGFNPGLLMGAGIHVFINKWIALDLSFRNYMFSDNPSGLDFDADLDVDEDDRRFLSHLYFGVGVSLYLPTKVKISR
jgi:outer membrane beta-barrel protein